MASMPRLEQRLWSSAWLALDLDGSHAMQDDKAKGGTESRDVQGELTEY